VIFVPHLDAAGIGSLHGEEEREEAERERPRAKATSTLQIHRIHNIDLGMHKKRLRYLNRRL